VREFGKPVGEVMRDKIFAAARDIFDRAEPKRDVKAAEFAMDDEPEKVVVHEVDVRFGEDRLRVAVTEEAARPPFEWLLEITSDVGEAEYFKHYLVRDHDVVLAQRKELTPLDDPEARHVLADLEAARKALD